MKSDQFSTSIVLSQSTAAIGQSVAAEFPKVTLPLGTVGFAATHPQDLFNGSNFTYLAGLGLGWAGTSNRSSAN